MIIGLCGIKGSGKSVVAKYISEYYGFNRVNFKDALIKHIKLRFPDTLNELSAIYEMSTDELFDKKPPAMRALMVNIGTDDKRRDNPRHWIDAYGVNIELSTNKNIVTDDVRFQNEYDAIRLLGGVIIRVKRSDITDGGSHPSETEQFEFEDDFTIEAAKGDHASVYKQIDAIMQTISAD